MKIRTQYIIILLIILTGCQNKLSIKELNGRWVADSIAVYNGGSKQIYLPNYSENEYSKDLLCNPFIIEFNTKKQIALYNLNDLDKNIETFHFNDNFIFIGNRKDSLQYIYNKNKLLQLDFLDEKEKITFYLSKSNIVKLNKNKQKINQDIFIDKMEDARRDFDEFKNFCRAYSKMINLYSSIKITDENSEFYANGIINSAYMLALDADKMKLAEELGNIILSRPNKKFYSIEYSSNNYSNSGLRARFWEIGYSHPQVEYNILLKKIEEDISSYDKAYIHKDFALRWHNFEWARMESSSGMSYGEKSVEKIYFNKELDRDIKIKLLKEIIANTKGATKGNAYYCLSLMDYKEKKMEYLINAKKAYQNATDIHHNREMINLIQSELK